MEFTLEKIRNNLKEHAVPVEQASGTQRARRYFWFQISPSTPSIFPKLTERFVDDFPALKRESILLSLSGQSRKMFEQKKDILAMRIPKATIISAIGDVVPVPAVSTAVDLGILDHLSPVKRICVFEHSVMTSFNCACHSEGPGIWLSV